MLLIRRLWWSVGALFVVSCCIFLFASAAHARALVPYAQAAPLQFTSRPITQITVGDNDTCVLTASGAVLCWGSLSQRIPAPVAGLAQDVTAITAGRRHFCALVKGGVKCWGENLYGQLGDGTTDPNLAPVTPVGLGMGVVAVAAGGNYSCALTTVDEVKCWGNSKTVKPTEVAGAPAHVVSLVAGEVHACLLTAEGAVQCWGNNDAGQLGNGGGCPKCYSDTPVAVTGLDSGVRAIAAGGSRTCAVTASGGVKCWGLNTPGRLGAGTTELYHVTPVDVVGLTDVTQVAVAARHICALRTTGEVHCWGVNDQQQLGDGTIDTHDAPTTTVGLPESALVVAIGAGHSCASGVSAAVYCWGVSSQLGVPENESLTPVTVSGLHDVQAVSGGRYHTCAIAAARVYCWGGNNSGQLGDQTTINRTTPVTVTTLGAAVRALAVGDSHSCAVTGSNQLYCWGANYVGQLGIGTATLSETMPVTVAALGTNVTMAAAGYSHTCAVLNNGAINCWGMNLEGQLGEGSSVFSRTLPVKVIGLTTGAQVVAAGSVHTCALHNNGGVACWGLNNAGQLGTDSFTNSSTPVAVSALSANIKAMATGNALLSYHTCVLTGQNTVSCWGLNNYGQLGDGTTTTRAKPVNVVNLPGEVEQIAIGYAHSCARLKSGQVYCWGLNDRGQLGDGTATNRLTPVAVVGLAEETIAIGLGWHHSCAVLKSGILQCWGSDEAGQLGDGPRQALTQPVLVLPPYRYLFLPVITR